jgi:arylsulfatase A-like enzyme
MMMSTGARLGIALFSLLVSGATLLACRAEEPAGYPDDARHTVDLATYWATVAPQAPGTIVGTAEIRQTRGTHIRLYLHLREDTRLIGTVHPASARARIGVAVASGEQLEIGARPTGELALDLAEFSGRIVSIDLVADPDGPEQIVWTNLLVESPMETRAPVDAPAEQPNIVLIVFDSLRADRVGTLGATSVETPKIDALGAGGVTFTNARAPASWTRASLTSMLTSVAPATHGISLLSESLVPGIPYLPELLAHSGYRTIAASHSAQISPELGFGRGFDRFLTLFDRETQSKYQAEPTPQGRAKFVWEAHVAPEIATRGESPFFLYLHEMDPHYPYAPPPPFEEEYAGGHTSKLDPTAHIPGLNANPPEWFGPRDVRYLEALYRGEIAFMDAYLGSILELLSVSGLAENTLVVLVSDHGDEFMEHGLLGHASTVYEELLRVPLFFSWPAGLPSGLRVETSVDLMDVAPTILNLVGVHVPESMKGESLVSTIRGDGGAAHAESRSFVAESYSRSAIALRHGRWKLIRTLTDPQNTGNMLKLLKWPDADVRSPSRSDALYDLVADPAEKLDRIAHEPFIGAALGQILDWELAQARTDAPAVPITVDPNDLQPESRANLKALGYLE